MDEIDGFEIFDFKPTEKQKPLRGPFFMLEDDGGFIILNCDGQKIIWFTDREVAQFTHKLYDLAYKYDAKSLNE